MTTTGWPSTTTHPGSDSFDCNNSGADNGFLGVKDQLDNIAARGPRRPDTSTVESVGALGDHPARRSRCAVTSCGVSNLIGLGICVG